MAPSTSSFEVVACDWPHAAATTRRASVTRTARRLGQLPMQLIGRRVAIVDVQGAPVGGHHDRGRQGVDVEVVGKLALGDGVDLVDAHIPELRQCRLLVSPAYGAVVAGEVE